jgi:hypothetical protein
LFPWLSVLVKFRHPPIEKQRSLISTEFLISIKQGNNIFDRRIGLDVMCRAETVAAISGQLFNTVFDLVSDIFDASIGHGLLNRYSAVEADFVAELLFYFPIVHPGTVRLKRIQDVQTALDKVRQQWCYTPAGMVRHFAAKLMADIDKALEAFS